MFSFLYQLLIGPLELLFEIIFSQANTILHNPGLAIIFLSLAMNFLVLPLYKRADAMQEEERQTEQRLKPWVSHIKKNFSGDERFMILQTFYRQNHYKPTDALKGTTSLLLEIPFFIAAYNFLSGLHLLSGVAFGPIRDLGAPDGMLVIAGVAINVLPILMTLINLVSSAIYTRGMSFKSKLQLYGMALIFLVLLYTSPAGLVFYWTLNNLFSLIKNIFYKLKEPGKILAILSSLTGAAALVVLLLHPLDSLRTQVLVAGMLLLLQLPLILYFVRRRQGERKPVVLQKKDHGVFLLGCLFLAILTGLLIPSAILRASPEEFIDVVTKENPLGYLVSSGALAAGIFLIWFGIFYSLASPRGKKNMQLVIWLLCGMAAVDYLFFGTDYGILSPTLKYDIFPVFSARSQVLNLGVLLIMAAVLWLIFRKKEAIVSTALTAAVLVVAGMSVFNICGASAILPDSGALEPPKKEQASIPLSRDGENVIVLMLDRAISSYTPFIFQEKPELQQQFAGFTYYPNTISFASNTMLGSSALYGGYEYTPEEMNRRDQESLPQKHNEALKLMPALFYDAGYTVTVFDPSYAGYHWIPDLHIYDEYPEMRTFNIEKSFSFLPREEKTETNNLRRNFFCHSLFKITPVVLQPMAYAGGSYNEADVLFASRDNPMYTGQIRESISKGSGLEETFCCSYTELMNLPGLTEIREGEGNTFLMMSNCTAHEAQLLQVPAYEPAMVVDNTAYDAEHWDRFTVAGHTMKVETQEQMMHYQMNMAAMIQIGRWLDHLRAEGVYDNTRIIIVADHGRGLGQFQHLQLGERTLDDIMFYNPLLMVKDFGSKEMTVDHSFMTNADTPCLAFRDLIQDPVNPFTGVPVDGAQKNRDQLHVFASGEWDVNTNRGTQFKPGDWYGVTPGDIHDPASWQRIPDPLAQ